MIRFLVPVILIVLAWVLALRYINTGPAGQRSARRFNAILVGLTIALLVLTLLHRMHWLAAIVPALVLAGRKLLAFLSGSPEQPAAKPTTQTMGNMNEDEAMKVLGLQKPYSKEDVIDTHRKLMQKLHPDRGGNDYLAAKINDAKEFLLKQL